MDPFTAITILAAHLLLSGGLLGLISRRRPVHSELRDWSIGATCFGLAFAGRVTTGLASKGVIPLVTDLLLVFGALVIWRGMARLGGTRVPPSWVAGPFLGIAAAHLAISARFDIYGRFVFLNGVLAVLYFVIFRVSWNAPSQMPRGFDRVALPVRMFGCVLLLLALASAGRTWHVAVRGTAVLYAGPAAAGYFVVSSVLVTMLELTLLWIVFERLNLQLAQMASRDPLTQVLNRAGLTTAIADHFAVRPTVPLVTLVLDVDHFKSINDRYGHAIGDRVLRTVVTEGLLRECRATDIVARTGGEEFAVLCEGASPEAAASLAERLCRRVGTLRISTKPGEPAVTCTISVGVSAPFSSSAEWESAHGEADRAMYAAKSAGRNRVWHAGGDAATAAPVQFWSRDSLA